MPRQIPSGFRIRRARAARVFMGVLALGGSGYAAAAEWSYELTPYLWASRMDGDVKAGPLPEISVDMKFSDILENLDFGFMTEFEARNGRWGLLLDGIYMKVSDSAKASNPPLSAKADAEIEQTMLAGAVAYRAVEGNVPLDVIGGLRYSWIDAEARIDASLFGQAGKVRRSGDKSWADPYIGVRVAYPLGDKWTAVGYADVGGFGVGSDFTWQGSVGFEYAWSKSVSAKFGYRYLMVDYDDDGFRYDMANDGMYAGVGMRF